MTPKEPPALGGPRWAYYSTLEDDIETFQTGSQRLKDMIGALRKHGHKDDEKATFTVAE